MEFLLALISLFLAGAAPAAPAKPSPPGAEEIRAAAESCSLPLRFLKFGRDAEGEFADVSPDGDPDSLRPAALMCILKWAGERKARVGFISEPPPGPQTIALGPIDSIRAAARAARSCGLPVHLDPLSPDDAVLQARADAPADQLRCALSWIEDHREEMGFRPLEELD